MAFKPHRHQAEIPGELYPRLHGVRVRFAIAALIVLVASGGVSGTGKLVTSPCYIPHALQDRPAAQSLSAGLEWLLQKEPVLEEDLQEYNADCDVEVDAGSPEDIACRQRREPLYKRWGEYEKRRKAHAVAVNDALDQELVRLKQHMSALSQQSKQWGHDAALYEKAIREWADFSESSRQQARRRAEKLAFELALDEALSAVKQEARFQRELSEQEIGLMRSQWGFIVDKLQRLDPAEKAQILDRISNARTLEQAVDAFQAGKGIIDSVYDAGKGYLDADAEEFGKAVVTALELIESLTYANPVSRLVIASFKTSENAVYGWWAALASHNRLQQFGALSEQLREGAMETGRQYIDASNRLRVVGEAHIICPRNK